ncbi:MAG: DoxX family protein [Prochloraceae cyanobacterium]|nr:DoxX family protein [Prochloraceae cyanobacterium]
MNLISIASAVLRPNFSTNYVSQIAWTIFRVVAGVFMIHNGLDKLGNIEGFAIAYVQYIGLPFPIFFSYCAAFTELLAGPLVALGLFTRPAAFGLLFTMSVAMYHHIKLAGLSVTSIELAGLYASCYLFLAVNGPGLFSIDAIIHGWLSSKSSEMPSEVGSNAEVALNK